MSHVCSCAHREQGKHNPNSRRTRYRERRRQLLSLESWLYGIQTESKGIGSIRRDAGVPSDCMEATSRCGVFEWRHPTQTHTGGGLHQNGHNRQSICARPAVWLPSHTRPIRIILAEMKCYDCTSGKLERWQGDIGGRDGTRGNNNKGVLEPLWECIYFHLPSP